MISLLVRSGASTAAVARRGYTPLHSACMRGRWHAVRALLAFGADANVRAEDQVRASVFVEEVRSLCLCLLPKLLGG